MRREAVLTVTSVRLGGVIKRGQKTTEEEALDKEEYDRMRYVVPRHPFFHVLSSALLYAPSISSTTLNVLSAFYEFNFDFSSFPLLYLFGDSLVQRRKYFYLLVVFSLFKFKHRLITLLNTIKDKEDHFEM